MTVAAPAIGAVDFHAADMDFIVGATPPGIADRALHCAVAPLGAAVTGFNGPVLEFTMGDRGCIVPAAYTEVVVSGSNVVVRWPTMNGTCPNAAVVRPQAG
jgi:hypothetical protein